VYKIKGKIKMSDKTLRNVLFGMLMTSGVALTGCSDRTEGNENDGAQQPQTEQQATPQRQVQNDPYGNVALFEASRSKIKFALAFVENYYPYIYWCGEAWTTGHGLTILYNADGSSKKVTQNTPIPTLEQSDVYKGRYLTHEILPDIKSCIKVPMDENTMIAACVLRYCLGHSNFAKSSFVKQLNAGKKGAELAKTLTGWRQQAGVINRCYFFAALMAGEIQYSDLLDLRAEGCYNLRWQDMLVYKNGSPKKDSNGFCTWDFSKIQENLQKAKKSKNGVIESW
jgi:GH24 family phage-related lysozyme (muramidase)